jgi:UDP-N-acetylglucosamine/UDP-N-acetylgalactosamine diphosphorylase
MTKYDPVGNAQRINYLRERGIEVWGPERVYISEDVPLRRIRPGAVLFEARISGESSFIGRGAKIGTSGLAVIDNTQIGEHAILGAGAYEGATLLARAKTRGFAELRAGTLLEEQAEVAHNVGLKNTIFTAAVVAGSCINFCDVFVSGGISRQDHSEIGSGTIHFNFDARGDKFGSLIGDVRGVLLRSRRIFIGGNVGLVAPLHIEFGAVVAAGSTIRKDIGECQMVSGGSSDFEQARYDPTVYGKMRRKLVTTAKLVGNLHALRNWYSAVRLAYADEDEKPVLEGAVCQIDVHLRHRVQELDKVLVKAEATGLNWGVKGLRSKIIASLLERPADVETGLRDQFLKAYEAARKSQNHIDAVHGLGDQAVTVAWDWLTGAARRTLERMSSLLGTND